MDSQIVHHPHHAHDHDHPHHAPGLHQKVEGDEDGQHHEKKSVLKKVKAKAKKIKDTITKHGHGQDHDHEDEEDGDDDDEVVEDPEIQGAPLYEGAAMRSAVGGLGQHQDVGIGMSTAMCHQAPPGPKETTSRPTAVDTGFTSVNNPATKEKLDNSAVAPNTTMSLSPSSLVKDPHAPKDGTNLHSPRHSEVKVADAAGRGNEEASGESQVFDTFAKMKVNDEHEPDRTALSSGTNQGVDQSSYSQKISAVGSAMGGKAVAAKDYVASKLGYGETTEDKTNTNTKSSSPLEYGKKIALTVTEKLKPGEEDRALSEVISGAFNRRKDEVVKVGESAFGPQQQKQPRGKVTESEKLTRRLGKEDNEATEGSAGSVGRSVVDMVKDTVGSWLGKAGDQSAAPSQQSVGTSQGVEGFMDGRQRKEHGGAESEVRILQDSAN